MQTTLHIAAPPRRLIINADDLGACAARDAGILDLFACGAITSASLLVDGRSALAAAASAVAADLPLGLHLNLSEGRRQTPSSLTDADGRLRGKFGLREALAADAVRTDDLVREIRRQFEAFIALTGELPSHVDGHHHCHIEPTVAAVLAPIMAREYGVYCVRLPQQDGLDAIAGDAEFDAAFQQAVARAAAAAWPVFMAQNIYSTDAFIGQSFMGTRLDAASVGAVLRELEQKHSPTLATPLSVELMVHPGLPSNDPACDTFCRSSARAHEMAVLQGEEWRAATSAWQRTSFRQLPRPGANNKPSLLIYGKLTPATGNAETARRYETAWSPMASIRFRPVATDIATPAALAREALRLQECAQREHLDLAFGIHLYRAGTPLAAAFGAGNTPPLPYGLLASGTDANADIDDPTRAGCMATALRHADFLLCLNEAQVPRLQPLGLPEDRCVLGNGIDIRTNSNYSLRQTLQLPADARLVLFPASLRRLKGVRPTIEALAELLATRFANHVLVVLGPVLEKDYADELRARIEALMAQHGTLRGHIHLHDGLPHADYLAALREADLVLNASEHEGLSHGLAEAMAAGVPVLARDIAGNRLLVRDGENGRLFADFAALPAAYAACFDEHEATMQMAAKARSDIAAAYPAEAEQQALRTVLDGALARRQTTLPLASGPALRLDLAPGTHPLSPENVALFRAIAFAPTSAPIDLAVDVGCGCGAFGLLLLDALAGQGKRLQRMLFIEPHQPTLSALQRTLTRHAGQLPMLDFAEFSAGSLLAPLLARGEKAALICANLPQTPAPKGFRLDRYGGSDGAELICALIAQLPATLADGGQAFMLHISLAHPARVRQTLAEQGLQATVLAEQMRTAALVNYECLLPGLADYLLAERAAGRAEFFVDGQSMTFHARLLRIDRI
jgi:predicted glycoside hydrolase/deacetylase ChbG (UPF0249 family)/glycosyltransferase involved in cell wall biosynthesis